jgi:hypothetical protein
LFDIYSPLDFRNKSVDGSYSKNKPLISLAFIIKIKHQDRFRGFKLTNSISLGEYLHAGEFSYSTGQFGP